MPSSPLLRSNLPFPVRRGKVRDVYEIGNVAGQAALLIVASDRISAFDVIMNEPIPGKGKILTALSVFWFNLLGRSFQNHLITADVAAYPQTLQPFGEQLRGRSMLVKKTEVVPIECVARGYLAGSGWAEYSARGTVCGQPLPPGLRQSERLPSPIFTPATKEESGHDVNISFLQMQQRVGSTLAGELRDRTLAIYAEAAGYAAQRGMIIADTKFEFGHLPGKELILIDEVLTPDSSRFWSADTYEPGHDQPSFDKQFLRNWLASQPWDKRPPAPPLPADVIAGTAQRYRNGYRLLTGTAWAG
jgi:phosphoribosylaminoimidazole-succinocarboxamide synthase